jgi:hypothetical protein
MPAQAGIQPILKASVAGFCAYNTNRISCGAAALELRFGMDL